MRYGLDKSKVRRIIESNLNENPDLKYYINNDYFMEYTNLLIDSICEAIEINNKEIVDDILKHIDHHKKV